MEQSFRFKVGDIVRPADGTSYRGEVLYISKEEDVVRHRDLETGKVHSPSYFGFFCRYSTLAEYDEVQREIEEGRRGTSAK